MVRKLGQVIIFWQNTGIPGKACNMEKKKKEEESNRSIPLKSEIKILSKCHSYFTDLLKMLGVKKNSVLLKQNHLDIFFESKNKQKRSFLRSILIL